MRQRNERAEAAVQRATRAMWVDTIIITALDFVVMGLIVTAILGLL